LQSATPRENRRHDLVVYGASGFVGRLVVEYLAARYPQGGALRWAVAGRSRARLEAMLEECAGNGARPDVIVADCHDRAALDRLARDTRVVLTTVGPYAKYGSELVAACVANGTDSCDLCGEVRWMRRMIDQHQAAAQASGARIVMCCGFDSIPSDLGVFALQQHARQVGGRPCSEITLFVRAMKGGVSGGTIASMLIATEQARKNESDAAVLADPYGLNPDGEREGPDGPDQIASQFHAGAGEWTAPFVMASINTRVVRRTNALLGHPHGRDFRYQEAIACGKGLRGRIKAGLISTGVRLLTSSSLAQRGVARLGPKPGEGPSRKKRESGCFNLLLIGKQADGKVLRLRVKGDRDPGYGSTSKMCAESAICLAKDELGTAGGFWTPAAAMGAPLLNRLTASAGLRFEPE